MFRCAMPVFTCVFEYLIYGTVRPLRVYLSLIPVIVGTMLVFVGDVTISFHYHPRSLEQLWVFSY